MSLSDFYPPFDLLNYSKTGQLIIVASELKTHLYKIMEAKCNKPIDDAY